MPDWIFNRPLLFVLAVCTVAWSAIAAPLALFIILRSI